MFLVTSSDADPILLGLVNSLNECEVYAHDAITVENLSTLMEVVRALCKLELSFEIQPWG